MKFPLLHMLLLILALVCFVLSAVGVQSRINLQSAGLSLWVLTLLLS
jgi:hypothetical protein